MYSNLSVKEHIEIIAERVAELIRHIDRTNDPAKIRSYEQMLSVNRKLIIVLASMANEPKQKYLQ